MPAPASTQTSIFFFTRADTASANNETLDSNAGSLSTPTIIGHKLHKISYPSKPYAKMLLYLELLPHDHQPDKKKIDGHIYPWITLDLLPGFLHFLAPVYIVKDEYGPGRTSLHD